jgi:SHS family lactate transporter-like MFS transporter
VGFLAWTCDAFDFFSTVLTLNELAVTFDESLTSISLGVTFALMSRPLGAAIFGIAADWFGRKWPFVINNLLLIIFELATGFCQTYQQFLAVRALFGIAMGGIYGNAASTALEDCPKAARGLFSGIYQSGYFFGYLLAAVFWTAFENTGPGWRLLFWFSACPPVILIIIRLRIPETNAFEGRKVLRNEKWDMADVFSEAKVAVRRHWLLLLYLVLLMTGFTYMVSVSSSAKNRNLPFDRLMERKTFIPQ